MVDIVCDARAPFLARVLKVTNDAELGRLAVLRILQGQLDAATPFVAASDKKPRRAGHIVKVEGRTRSELGVAASAGDLVGLAKIEDLHVDQILHDPAIADEHATVRPAYPEPIAALTLTAVEKKEFGRLEQALTQLVEEDPTLAVTLDAAAHEAVVRGLGQLHVTLVAEHLASRYGLAVKIRPT